MKLDELNDWLFDPYEEPEDNYDLNMQGISWVIFVLNAIPVFGMGPIFLSCYERYTNNPTVGNNFNIDNVAWNSTVYAIPVNILLTSLILVVLL